MFHLMNSLQKNTKCLAVNSLKYLIVVLLLISTSSVSSIELLKQKKEEKPQKTEEQIALDKQKAPYIMKNTAPWTLGYYNKYTDEKIKYKELQKLINSVPQNSKYKTRDIAYTTMGSIGAVMMITALIVPASYKMAKKTLPRAAFNSSMALVGVGFVTTTVFFSLKNRNRDKAIERYNEYVLGIKQNF